METASACDTSAHLEYASACTSATPARACNRTDDPNITWAIALKNTPGFPSANACSAALAITSFVTSAGTRPSRISVFNRFRPVATFALIVHDKCEAHHLTAVSTPNSPAAMFWRICFTGDTDGSNGESTTAE